MGGLKGRDRLLSGHRWKCIEKLNETVSTLKIVEEVS